MRSLSLWVLMLGALLGPSLSLAGTAAPPTTEKGLISPAIAMHGVPRYPPGFAAFDYVNPDAPKGGTLRTALAGGFDSLNPFIVRGRPAFGLESLFESLMARAADEPFTLYGLIAESVETPPDRSWVLFRLRPEARWHDGTPITPADVLFSWETLRTQGRPNHRTYYNRVRLAEPVGAHGVRFVFAPLSSSPAGPVFDRELPLIMGLMPILPQAWWRTRVFDRTTLEPPLGSGPYRIVAVDPGRSVRYRRVPDYWGRDLAVRRGTANFDELRYDYYRDDEIALEAFKAGAADLRHETDPTRWATAYDFPAVREGRVRMEAWPHGRPEPMRAFVFNTRRWPFQDRQVRRALGYAFDFEWINRVLFHGAYVRTTSYYPNSELAATGAPTAAEIALLAPFRAELPPELFSGPFEPPHTDGSGPMGLRANLHQALWLFTEAGWRLEDGRLLDHDNRPLAFEILLNAPADQKVALEFARGLHRLGIAARVRVVDSAQFQGRLESFDYDMVLTQWSSTLSPGNEQEVFFGSAEANAEGGRNYAGVRSRAVDALTSALGQAVDRTDLITRIHALDRVLSWGYYGIPLYHANRDMIASWCGLRWPAVVPVNGFSPDTGWWAPAHDDCR